MKKRVAKNTAIRVVAHGLNLVFSAGFLIFVTRRLGSADFGRYAMAFALADMFGVISEIGIHTQLTKEIARDKDNSALVFGNVLIIKFFLVLIFFMVLFVTTNMLDYSRDVLYLIFAMGIFVVITSFLDMLSAVFRGYEKMEYEAAAIVFNRLVVVSSGIFALYAGLGLKGFVTAMVIGNFLSVWPVINVSFKKFPPPIFSLDLRLIRVMLRGALPIGMMLLFSTITFKIGIILLPLFRNYAETGLYGAPLKLIESLRLFPIFFTTAVFPVFVNLYVKDRTYLIKWLEGSLQVLFITGIPLAIAVTLLGDKVVSLFFGSEYFSSSEVFQLMIWATFFMSLNMLLGYFMIAIDKQKLNMVTYGAGALGTAILSLILIPSYGYTGAGISLLLGQVILFFFAMYFTKAVFSEISIVNTALKPLFCGLLTGIIVFYAAGINVMLLILISILSYGSLLFIFKAVHRESISLVKGMLRKS